MVGPIWPCGCHTSLGLLGRKVDALCSRSSGRKSWVRATRVRSNEVSPKLLALLDVDELPSWQPEVDLFESDADMPHEILTVAVLLPHIVPLELERRPVLERSAGG